MSPPPSPLSSAPKRKPATRALSASEIARNPKHFEVWAQHQHLDHVSFSDIPSTMTDDVRCIFDVSSQLPLAWVDKEAEGYQDSLVDPEVRRFLKMAHESRPFLFSAEVEHSSHLIYKVTTVWDTWNCYKRMRSSDESWSEADWAANVYNPLRHNAFQKSNHRVQTPISLPQSPSDIRLSADNSALRVLNTKTAIPDVAIFLPASLTRSLSSSADSPFGQLKQHPNVREAGSPLNGTSFRYQCTPRVAIPNTPGFEFASAFCEDKKNVDCEVAIRQNRMATASAVRHLAFLHVKAPIVGIVWADGMARAHVDWKKGKGKSLRVRSAPFPGLDGGKTPVKWNLSNAAEILQVFLTLRNIDAWTVGRFKDLVHQGVKHLLKAVVGQDCSGSAKPRYLPWKRSTATEVKPSSTRQRQNTAQRDSPSKKSAKQRRRRSTSLSS